MKYWYEAYRYIAILLNDFYTINQNNSARALLEKLNIQEYRNKNKWLSQAIEKYDAAGIDPIQLFASFNNSNSKNENRIDNINLIMKILGSDEQVTNSHDFFNGCPSPVITQVINSRKDIYQSQIWGVFNNIVSKGKEGLIQDHFELMYNWYGIDIASFTMFLFWIDSDNFLPLDQNTSTFLIGLRIVEQRPKNYNEYITLCKLDNNNGVFRSIVKDAYSFVHSRQERISFSSLTDSFLEKTGKVRKSISENEEDIRKRLSQNFKIIAIRPREKEDRIDIGDKQKHLKNLQENEIYTFYNSYSIDKKDDTKIKYNESVADLLYNSEEMKISISAVVGKNGSGKSTITELLFLAINKIAKAKIEKPEETLLEEEVFVDLYIKSDFLYKIYVGKNNFPEIKRYLFNSKENIYENPTLISIEQFDLESFCYSILINYSLYSLNSKIIGEWINPLFHKNDSYQVPIVLNPKRDSGIIDVNIEEQLASSRLLSNILEPSRVNFEDGVIPELIEGKEPENIKIELDIDKRNYKREKYFTRQSLIEEDIEKIDLVIEHLYIKEIKAKDFVNDTKEYIYCKICSICNTYKKYDEYRSFIKDNKIDIPILDVYLKKLLVDKSHVVFKLKQAINYLKYGHISFDNYSMPVLELSMQINKAKTAAFQNEQNLVIKTIELVPPSLFKTTIFFKQGSTFNKLSSGEKQIIFAVNTILYHLINIDSVEVASGVLKYNFINVVFDEVELYFHPDMQRTYIHHLINRIKGLDLKSITNINVIFITHSPFILSDIPSLNILKLNEGWPQKYKEDNETFSANVHELLKDSFFLSKGYLGEFARERITDLIEYLKTDKDAIDVQFKWNWNEQDAEEFIELIGEPLIRESLRSLFDKKYFTHDRALIQKRIETLNKELEKLK